MIEIDYPNEGKIFCPACGTLTLGFGESGREFEMNECPHLEWLGSDEGPEFDRNKLWAQWNEWQEKAEKEDDGKGDWNIHFIEYFEKILDDHYVCFTQCTPAPSGLCGQTIFKFEDP